MKKDDLIIVRVDGGISSQINFYAIGAYFMSQNYHVKFDLTWFETDGLDMDGRFARNFDLLKAFPSLPFEEATHDEIKYYSKKYPKKTNNIFKMKPPLYLDGYPSGMKYLLENRTTFAERFTPPQSDLKAIQTTLDDICAHCSCAVHVRRGDLAMHTDTGYGRPCSEEYFISAIKIINALVPKVKFYFFSDEMSWVNDFLIPQLPQNLEYKICEQNGSDKGYLDLYLMTKCQHFIASKGSFGRFARILSKNEGYFINPLIALDLKDYFNKCIFLSLEKETIVPFVENFRKKRFSYKLKKFFINFVPSSRKRKELRQKLK